MKHIFLKLQYDNIRQLFQREEETKINRFEEFTDLEKEILKDGVAEIKSIYEEQRDHKKELSSIQFTVEVLDIQKVIDDLLEEVKLSKE